MALKTEEIAEKLNEIKSAVEAADKLVVELQADPHARKCPIINSARAATTAGAERLGNALDWLKQNPAPAAAAPSKEQ